MLHKGNKRKEATFDHRIPKSKGGTYDLSNGILSCAFCNNMRGQMSVGKFRSIIKQHGSVEGFKKARKERRRQKRAERRLKRAPQQAEFLMNLAMLLYLINKQYEISSSSL